MAEMTAKTGIWEPPAKPKITKAEKEAMKASGLSKEEQKKALAAELQKKKEIYAAANAQWNQRPDTDAAEAERLEKIYKEVKASKAAVKAEIDKKYKEDVAKAQELDPSAKKLALVVAKDKRRNAMLDYKEALRVAEANYFKATKSSAEIWKIQQRKKTLAAIWRDRYLYVMLIPFLAFYAIFMYKPMWGLQIAFKDYSPFKGVAASPWADNYGFEYFITFLTGPYLGRLMRNTLMINVWSIIFSFPMPIIFALMLNEVRVKWFKTTVQTVSYLPHFISAVVVAGIVIKFLSPSNGIINTIYKLISGSDTGIYFLTKPEYFRTIYITMGIWQGTGFGSIIYTSALAGIDMELYEAARIDGAGRWSQLWHVTLPGILPTVAIMLIMRVGGLLNVGYETIILLYQPITYETADVISTYVYRMGLVNNDYSLATAVGLFNGIIALILVLGSNTISRKIGDVGLW